MNEDMHRLWDTGIKSVTALIMVGLLVTGLLQYKEESKHKIETQKIEREKLEIESRKLSFELTKRKTSLLTEAAATVATLASSVDNVQLGNALNRFWQLYYGELVLVEEGSVESEMVITGNLIESKYPNVGALLAADRTALKNQALQLSKAAKSEAPETKGQLK